MGGVARTLKGLKRRLKPLPKRGKPFKEAIPKLVAARAQCGACTRRRLPVRLRHRCRLRRPNRRAIGPPAHEQLAQIRHHLVSERARHSASARHSARGPSARVLLQEVGEHRGSTRLHHRRGTLHRVHERLNDWIELRRHCAEAYDALGGRRAEGRAQALALHQHGAPSFEECVAGYLTPGTRTCTRGVGQQPHPVGVDSIAQSEGRLLAHRRSRTPGPAGRLE